MTKNDIKKMKKIELREAPFEITGLPWLAETGTYDRIPSDKLPDSCTDLFKEIARRTTGVMARIRTNSPQAYFKAEMEEIKAADLYQLSRLGRSGFDFHIKYPGEEQRFLQPSVPIAFGHRKMECEVAVRKRSLYDERPLPEELPPVYELTIVFPTYNNVEEAYLYVDPDAVLLPPEPRKYEKPVLFYGSSITQGAAANRTSLCYTNRLALELDTPIINFGFGGHAMGEDFMADLIIQQDISAFVLDYDHNAPNAEHLRKTHEPFFRKIRAAKPELPILIMTKPDYGKTLDDNDVRREIIRATYENALAAGDKNVWFVDGKEFFEGARDLCTVDTCHPNDLGFDRMTKRIKPVLAEMLEARR